MSGYEVSVHHGEEEPHQNVSKFQLDKEGDNDRMEKVSEDVRHELLPDDYENPP